MKKILFLLLVAAGVFAFALTASAAEGPAVFAHYMPWFKAEPLPNGGYDWDHWQWYQKGPKHDPDDILDNGQRDIASVFYPLIGAYDGRDPTVLEYHMLAAKTAGIEGFIADWYGPGSYTDEVFAQMVKSAERYGMKVAICLEEKAFYPPYTDAKTRDDLIDHAERHIRHVLDTHAQSSAYYRFDGMPVFYIFNGHGEGPVGKNNLSPDELKSLLGRFAGTPIMYVRGDYGPDYVDVVPGMYAWVGDAAYREKFYEAASKARAEGKLEYYAGVANPGFDDSGVHGWGRGPRVVDRRGTKEYEEQWKDVLPYEPNAIQIATWNDFQEGTTVEPTVEYGHSFLDITERYVAAVGDHKLKLNDNKMPLRIYHLRGQLADIADVDTRKKLEGRIDAYADAFADGKRFLMGWKLTRLENKLSKAVKSGR